MESKLLQRMGDGSDLIELIHLQNELEMVKPKVSTDLFQKWIIANLFVLNQIKKNTSIKLEEMTVNDKMPNDHKRRQQKSLTPLKEKEHSELDLV